jgi:hypothetical protein
LVTIGQEYDESRFAADQQRHNKRQEGKLRAKAKAMGFELVTIATRVRSFRRELGQEPKVPLPNSRKLPGRD